MMDRSADGSASGLGLRLRRSPVRGAARLKNVPRIAVANFLTEWTQMQPTNPPIHRLRPGFWRTRCGATVELMKWNGKHWIGKMNSKQHWHDRWWQDGQYAATSERFRAFDIVAAEVV